MFWLHTVTNEYIMKTTDDGKSLVLCIEKIHITVKVSMHRKNPYYSEVYLVHSVTSKVRTKVEVKITRRVIWTNFLL